MVSKNSFWTNKTHWTFLTPESGVQIILISYGPFGPFGPSELFGPSFLFLLGLVLQGPCNLIHRNGKQEQQNFLQNIFASVCIHVV